ncbi:MAG: hypothetical protein U1G07_08905 [Verrucomicrobiota bacterium]
MQGTNAPVVVIVDAAETLGKVERIDLHPSFNSQLPVSRVALGIE